MEHEALFWTKPVCWINQTLVFTCSWSTCQDPYTHKIKEQMACKTLNVCCRKGCQNYYLCSYSTGLQYSCIGWCTKGTSPEGVPWKRDEIAYKLSHIAYTLVFNLRALYGGPQGPIVVVHHMATSTAG